MVTSKRRRGSLQAILAQSRETGLSIGCGKNCKPISDFTPRLKNPAWKVDNTSAPARSYSATAKSAPRPACRRSLCCPFTLRYRRPHFRNAVAATEWPGIWQLDLGCGADSFQFHGGPGFGKLTRRVLENSPVAAASALRRSRNAGRIFWLHNCFCSASAWRFVAASVANAVELSADSPRTALCRFFRDPAGANDSHGFDVAGND